MLGESTSLTNDFAVGVLAGIIAGIEVDSSSGIEVGTSSNGSFETLEIRVLTGILDSIGLLISIFLVEAGPGLFWDDLIGILELLDLIFDMEDLVGCMYDGSF